MRVIAGSRKGHTLIVPRGQEVRPTSDRVRTVLFDMLGDFVAATDVLDLFAGAGTLGLEALSRGANWVDFVEKNRRHAQALEENLRRTHLENHARVILADAFVFLSRPFSPHAPYHLIFADPPYGLAAAAELLPQLQARGLLAPGGRIVWESSARRPAPHPGERLTLLAERKVGETMLRFYQGK